MHKTGRPPKPVAPALENSSEYPGGYYTQWHSSNRLVSITRLAENRFLLP